jgi:hypothetical protein
MTKLVAPFLALVPVAFLSAQTATPTTPPPSNNASVTVRGCVAAGQRNGSLAPNPTATSTPNTAPMEANNPDPVYVYMLLDATTAAATSRSSSAQTYTPARTSYGLAGHETEVAKHNGYRVEITGSIMPTVGSGSGTAKATVADGVQRVRVESVKRIPGTCSSTKK